MAAILIKHQVRDYIQWKQVFDQNLSFRLANGEQSYQIYHTLGDPNELTIMLEWEDADLAEKFMESVELHQKMIESGVVGEVEVQILQEVEARATAVPDLVI